MQCNAIEMENQKNKNKKQNKFFLYNQSDNLKPIKLN